MGVVGGVAVSGEPGDQGGLNRRERVNRTQPKPAVLTTYPVGAAVGLVESSLVNVESLAGVILHVDRVVRL